MGACGSKAPVATIAPVPTATADAAVVKAAPNSSAIPTPESNPGILTPPSAAATVTQAPKPADPAAAAAAAAVPTVPATAEKTPAALPALAVHKNSGTEADPTSATNTPRRNSEGAVEVTPAPVAAVAAAAAPVAYVPTPAAAAVVPEESPAAAAAPAAATELKVTVSSLAHTEESEGLSVSGSQGDECYQACIAEV